MKNNFKFTRVKVIVVALLSISNLIFATPQGGNVLEGNAVIEQNGELTTITQHSEQTLIQWQSFDVDQAQKVEFIQPNTNSIVINNIVGGQASFINGEITANGQVVLINNQGFVFTSGSFLQADSLTLAAADLSQDDEGNWLIQSTGENAKIINAGVIEVQNGHLILLANQIVNTGDIINHFGDIKIIADQGGFYGLDPNGLTYLALPQEFVNSQATLIDQSGLIQAQNGNVDLTVISRNDVLDAMLNHSGNTYAGRLFSDEGEAITFNADNINMTGLLSTDNVSLNSRYLLQIQNASVGIQSASIELNAENITIKNSWLDASHSNNAGSIKIGGMHLDGSAQAKTVTVDEYSVFNVSSTQAGNAGDSIVWSTNGTSFKGSVYATGGSESGDGGFVEISAKHNLYYDGFVDTTASQGDWGLLLLDPDDIIISDGATAADDAQIADGTISAIDGGLSTYTISEQALEAASATSNISLYANHSIIINDLSDDTLSLSQGGTVNINVSNSDNTKDNGSAYIIMEDKNDTIEITGSGALKIEAFGRTTSSGEVVIDIGNINKIGTGQLLIAAEQIDIAADDNVGVMSISTGDLTAQAGIITIRGVNNASNVGSQGINVTLGNVSSTGTIAIQLSSHSAIDVNLQNVVSTKTSSDGLQATLASGSGMSTINFAADVTTFGSNINLVTDNVVISNDIILDTIGSNPSSGDLNFSGIVSSFDAQGNSLTLNTGTLLNLNVGFSKFTNVNELIIDSDKSLSVGDTHVASSLNFTQTLYDDMEVASDSVTFTTTDDILSTNLSITKDLTLLADNNNTIGALTLSGFSATNASLSLSINNATNLMGLDLGTGGLNLIVEDESLSVGFGGSLTTDIQFSEAQIDSWNLTSVTSTNAESYVVQDLTTTHNFFLGDGTQTIRLGGVTNTFASVEVDAIQSIINSDVITTSGNINVTSADAINLNANLTSADSITLTTGTRVNLGDDVNIAATNAITTLAMGSDSANTLNITAGGDSAFGIINIPGADLNINFDENGVGNNTLTLNSLIIADNVVIESHGLVGSTANDSIVLNGEVTATSFDLIKFTDIELNADLNISDGIDFTSSNLLVESDLQISAQTIDLATVNSSNDSNLVLSSLGAVSLNTINLGLGDLNIDTDSAGLLISNVNFLGQVDVNDLNITTHNDTSNIADDFIAFNEAVNVLNIDILGFKETKLFVNLNATNNIDTNNTLIKLMSNVELNAVQINLADVLSLNDASLIVNVDESLNTMGMNLGNGNLTIHLDNNATVVSQVNIAGNIIANDIIIDAQNAVNSTLDDQLTIGGTIDASNIQFNGFANITINADMTLSGDLDIDGLEASIAAQISAVEFNYISQDGSELIVIADSSITVNNYTNNTGVRGSGDFELNILNPSANVNLNNIILTNSDFTLDIRNISNVTLDQLGADNINITNNGTADLSMGEVVAGSVLDIDGFNDISFNNNLILANLDLNIVNDIIQTDGTSIEIEGGLLDINAGGDIYVTAIKSNNVDDNTVTITAGGNLIDVNDSQTDFIVDHNEVLNITAGITLDEFEVSYETGDPDPVDPDPVDPDPVDPDPVDPVIIDEIDVIQDQVEDVLSQPEEDSDNTEEAVEETNESRVTKQEKSLDAQFEQCDEQDKNCEKQNAVKSFLGRLLIGGELPE
ncbi:MAG: filamentous hemagglutinin N-terminal domain-containing protein [Saccharospirillaceae bacterium]|nr:filamentous hemagglutinin N-terminal domain-containing protein [Saccharospirillaceae bacterium]